MFCPVGGHREDATGSSQRGDRHLVRRRLGVLRVGVGARLHQRGWRSGGRPHLLRGIDLFTSASFLQLLQSENPAMTQVHDAQQNRPEPVAMWRWLPHDRSWLAAITQFPGTLFFNISTLAALAQNATVEQQDRHVWRPDAYGSALFLVASVFGILAVGRFWSFQPRSVPWQIAWLNMIGSILFMASASAAMCCPPRAILSTFGSPSSEL